MGLFDGIVDFLTPTSVRDAELKRRIGEMALAEAMSAQSNKASLLGGFDPLAPNGGYSPTGAPIIWNARQAPSGYVSLLGDDGDLQRMKAAQAASLFDRPDAGASDQVQNAGPGNPAMASMLRDVAAAPERFGAQQAAWLAGAAPDAMVGAQIKATTDPDMINLKGADGSIVTLPKAQASALVRAQPGAWQLVDKNPANPPRVYVYDNETKSTIASDEQDVRKYSGNPRYTILGNTVPADILPQVQQGKIDIARATRQPRDAWRVMTAEEKAARNLPAAETYQVSDSGKVEHVGAGKDPLLNGIPDGVSGPDLLTWLEQSNPNDAARVKALIGYQEVAPRGTANPTANRLIALAERIDPTYSAADSANRQKLEQDFKSGKSAQNITAINTAIGHMGDLYDRAMALNNSNYPWINGVANFAADKTGDPRVKAFNFAKQSVANEMRKVFSGASGGSLQELQEWQRALDASSSPDQFRQVLQQGAGLLRSRVEALNEQYNRGMGRNRDIGSWINPRAKDTLKKVGASFGEDEYAAPGAWSIRVK